MQPSPPPSSPPRRTARGTWSWRRIVGVFAVVVGVLAALVLFTPAPSIQLRNANAMWTSGCFLNAPPHILTWTFALVNSGNEAGTAKVVFYVDNQVFDTAFYHVDAGQTVQEMEYLSVNDCLSHTWSIAIEYVT